MAAIRNVDIAFRLGYRLADPSLPNPVRLSGWAGSWAWCRGLGPLRTVMVRRSVRV